jgi:hypothetical protein
LSSKKGLLDQLDQQIGESSIITDNFSHFNQSEFVIHVDSFQLESAYAPLVLVTDPSVNLALLRIARLQ